MCAVKLFRMMTFRKVFGFTEHWFATTLQQANPLSTASGAVRSPKLLRDSPRKNSSQLHDIHHQPDDTFSSFRRCHKKKDFPIIINTEFTHSRPDILPPLVPKANLFRAHHDIVSCCPASCICISFRGPLPPLPTKSSRHVIVVDVVVSVAVQS